MTSIRYADSQQEREFLIRLAPVWLACRWRIMGHKLTNVGRQWPAPDLVNDLLGCHDYAAEMRLLCAEASKRPLSST
jgi:hypothetical protein